METTNPTSSEGLNKTLTFKVSRSEHAQIKELCEQTGMTLSDFLRQQIQSNPVTPPGPDALPHQLQLMVDLQLANAELARLNPELAQSQHKCKKGDAKKKALKKALAEALAEIALLKSQAEGGLSGLVTQNPALGEMISNVIVRIATSETAHKTLGAIMGVNQEASSLTEDEKACLRFWQELAQKLAPAELGQVMEICLGLADRKELIGQFLKTLWPPGAPRPNPTSNPVQPRS